MDTGTIEGAYLFPFMLRSLWENSSLSLESLHSPIRLWTQTVIGKCRSFQGHGTYESSVRFSRSTMVGADKVVCIGMGGTKDDSCWVGGAPSSTSQY